MEFLKALEDAKQLGIAKEDFVKIWEQEMKLKQQKEESKILELKLSSANLQDSTQAQSMKDQVKNVLQNHLKELKQQVSELKSDLVQQNNAQFQKMSKQFENQAAVTAMVIRNELENTLAQYGVNANSSFCENAPYVYDGLEQPKQGQKQQHKSSRHHLADSSQGDDDEELFPTEDGAILYVRDVDQQVADVVTVSSDYVLPECSSKVRLSIWFNSKGHLCAQLLVCGVKEQSPKSRIFTITGHIQNKNSGSFSPLFEGTSQPLRKFRPNKEKQVATTVCLKTAKAAYENITFDELEKRNFVINSTLIIKWFVSSEISQE